MKGIRSGRATGLRRGAAIALVTVLAFGAAACGEDSGDDAGTDDATADTAGGPTTTLTEADLLGEPNPAEGDPVLIGLLGTGGGCAQCSEGGAVEEPMAEAAIAWANDHLGGIAGRPIELVVCNNELDPSKATDCANELISQDVNAVIMGADSTITGWEVLHEAGIPVVNQSTTQTSMIEDPDSTFILQGSNALTVEFPLGAAQDVEAEKVSILVIDVPSATDVYTDEVLSQYEDVGIEVEVIPVAFGTPDMTPQAQQIVQSNPDGLVNIVGHDAFCIPAIQGLAAAGFTGTIATISYCITDAMREAIPSEQVEGILLAASDSLGDPEDPSTQQFNAILDEYDPDIARDSSSAAAILADVSALAIGTAGLEGEVTPESIIEAMRSMDNAVLPGQGGRTFRCNGNADPTAPSVCMNSGLSGVLNAEGRPESYTKFNDEPIPD